MKEKVEYVNEFRKISTIEKLPVERNIFEDEVQKSNKNFFRMRKE